jgi:hypothetical protein
MLNTATVSAVKISKTIYAGGDGQLSFNLFQFNNIRCFNTSLLRVVVQELGYVARPVHMHGFRNLIQNLRSLLTISAMESALMTDMFCRMKQWIRRIVSWLLLWHSQGGAALGWTPSFSTTID